MQCWPLDWVHAGLNRDLIFLEFFPISCSHTYLACTVTKSWCDKQAVIHVVNRFTSRSYMVMRLVRSFILQCLQFNILFIAQHVPGMRNDTADALSHFEEQ